MQSVVAALIVKKENISWEHDLYTGSLVRPLLGWGFLFTKSIKPLAKLILRLNPYTPLRTCPPIYKSVPVWYNSAVCAKSRSVAPLTTSNL